MPYAGTYLAIVNVTIYHERGVTVVQHPPLGMHRHMLPGLMDTRVKSFHKFLLSV